MFQVVSYADSILFKWIKTYLIAFLVMLVLPIIFDIIEYIYPEMKSYKGSWWFYLFFSIVMYYVAVMGYSNPVLSSIPYKMSLFNKNPVLLLGENQPNETETIIDIQHETFKETISPEIEHWKSKIETLIQEQKLYQNPELTLTDLAKKLETNASIISKTINQGFQMNFNDCINNYRIEAVKNSFAEGEHKKSTLLGIAYDCGFNSKATFNRAFKKNTGKIGDCCLFSSPQIFHRAGVPKNYRDNMQIILVAIPKKYSEKISNIDNAKLFDDNYDLFQKFTKPYSIIKVIKLFFIHFKYKLNG